MGTRSREAPGWRSTGRHVEALFLYLVEEQVVKLGRVQGLQSDLFAVQMGSGTLVAWVQHAAVVLAPVEDQIKVALRRTPVLQVDETGVRL